MLYVDVILPLYLANSYTYSVAKELEADIAIGKRVMVQFGKSRLYSAIIVKVHNTSPEIYKPKSVIEVIDEKPIVSTQQLNFWHWLASYYMCTVGEVMNAALPSGLKMQSTSKVTINEDFIDEASNLTPTELQVFDYIYNNQSIGLNELYQAIKVKGKYKVIKALFELRLIYIYEDVKDEVGLKSDYTISLNTAYDNEDELSQLMATLEKKAPKQLDALLLYVKLSNRYQNALEYITKAEVSEAAEDLWPQFKALENKGVFRIEKLSLGQIKSRKQILTDAITLSDAQQEAYTGIVDTFKTKQVCLFQGITSSGKTEIYFKLINEVLKQGQQVLVLLPEISLATQIVGRFKKVFGNKIALYHSKQSESERADIWQNVLGFDAKKEQGYNIILGARSALLLPYANLGLIIVDEEHENTYKQNDPAPRYHARDAAIYLASTYNAKTLLGSATPSIESYHNATTGKYGLVQLNQRFNNKPLPTIELINVKEAKERKQMHSHFSKRLLDEISLALENKQQVILFQNRRGFAPFLECANCAYVPQCINCDVSLTYHKQQNILKCHYCSYQTGLLSTCSACGSHDLMFKGFGTEKIEDELNIFFPNARVARMDLDTTRSKNYLAKLIKDFETHQLDILTGTQMLTKGLDFDNVSLVGILDADGMLNQPDFRAHERAYQLMVQVSGRSGRKNTLGKVLIQTANPSNQVLQYIFNRQQTDFYQAELATRQEYKYPPFYKMLKVILKCNNLQLLQYGANHLGQQLRGIFNERVLGPEFAPIAQIKNQYIMHIVLKFNKQDSTQVIRQTLNKVLDKYLAIREFKTIKTFVDVDPA